MKRAEYLHAGLTRKHEHAKRSYANVLVVQRGFIVEFGQTHEVINPPANAPTLAVCLKYNIEWNFTFFGYIFIFISSNDNCNRKKS